MTRDVVDLTPHITRLRRTEFARCTGHDVPVGVADDGGVFHVLADDWHFERANPGALAFWVYEDGRETSVSVEPCAEFVPPRLPQTQDTNPAGPGPNGTQEAE